MASAAAQGLEGVVVKRLTSSYRPGHRSPDWIKTPFSRNQEVVVVGHKPGTGRRTGTIGSLVLAVHDRTGALVFAGGVGTGFTDAELHHLQQVLAPLHRSTPPVTDIPREHARGVHWVQPSLVGEVAYRNWTPDGRLRHPSWRGLRPDRAPAEVRRPAAADPDAPALVRTATVEGAMQSPDGRWRIEVMRRGTSRWYRLTHHDNVLDWLTITDVARILTDVGVDISHLTETGPTTAAGSVPPDPGSRAGSGPGESS